MLYTENNKDEIMQLHFNTSIAKAYKSSNQRSRVLSEDWVGSQIFCPKCGNNLRKFPNNQPVADFCCENCKEEYELKSTKNNFGKKIVDGAYTTMIERLQSQNNPNFFFLKFKEENFKVVDFYVIPKHFFTPTIIEKRKPLSKKAKRAGWTGCNILFNTIPASGKIFYIKNKEVESKEHVLANYSKTLFLREIKKIDSKGWSLDIMNCIDTLHTSEFTLQDMYSFEKILSRKHPKNKHIKDKIRQQLQFLRDKEYLSFLGNGKYQLQ